MIKIIFMQNLCSTFVFLFSSMLIFSLNSYIFGASSSNIEKKIGSFDITLFVNICQPDRIIKYINNGGGIDSKDKQGQTLLMYVIALGNKEMVKLLLDFGADLSIKNNNGQTALGVAKEAKASISPNLKGACLIAENKANQIIELLNNEPSRRLKAQVRKAEFIEELRIKHFPEVLIYLVTEYLKFPIDYI